MYNMLSRELLVEKKKLVKRHLLIERNFVIISIRIFG